MCNNKLLELSLIICQPNLEIKQNKAYPYKTILVNPIKEKNIKFKVIKKNVLVANKREDERYFLLLRCEFMFLYFLPTSNTKIVLKNDKKPLNSSLVFYRKIIF